MATTAAPDLRRSKRKLDQQAANPVPNTNNAPAPKKRARKATTSDITPIQTRPVYTTLPPFLALPRELRDEIYKHVLESDNTSTLKSGARNIVTRCGLAGVNKQICDEYIDAVLFYAPVITTTVRNHNFAPIVTFLNRLSQAQLKRLSNDGLQVAGAYDSHAVPMRKIRIILSYTAGAKDSHAQLNRWLDRFDNPDKRGLGIEFEYEGDGTWDKGGYKQRPRPRVGASKRWIEEARKVREGGRGRKRNGWYAVYGRRC
ncbi:hypothetical protein J4E93_001195 [Alternaria ventricosa]|uniref:uncharacterized protein n=1 Tax=Alternaria ventricosa TaxID=1187951 RepID=UPI0020C2DDE9|nr:uncharacterized protein J4E93_001195 [Alternaria ventricosa]KAI4653429.1 hypothetical protein J4E93_001195 [Alternaria ventricosa]